MMLLAQEAVRNVIVVTPQMLAIGGGVIGVFILGALGVKYAKYWKRIMAMSFAALAAGGFTMVQIDQAVKMHDLNTRAMPGPWYALYQDLQMMESPDIRLFAIETFIDQHPDAEQLSAIGLDRFCSLLSQFTDVNATVARINKVKEKAGPFVRAITPAAELSAPALVKATPSVEESPDPKVYYATP